MAKGGQRGAMGKIDRRLFLRGLGGTAIAAPFLGTLDVRPAIGQTDAAAPKRIILYFTHYGCITDKWFPEKSHGELTPADLEGTNLAPLKDYAPKCLMPRGIRGMNEFTFEREFGQGNDPHAQVMGAFLTAAPVNRDGSIPNGISFDHFSAMPYGRSIDHYIADQLHPDGRGPLVVHMGGPETEPLGTLSYSAPLEPYRGLGSAASMYMALTNITATEEGLSEAAYAVTVRKQSAVDLVREDLRSLLQHRMSQSDRDKLEHWTELLHEVTAQVRPEICAATADSAADLDLEEPADWHLAVPTMMDLAVMHAMCDQSRITLLQMPIVARMHHIEGISANYDHHGLSHRSGLNANVDGPCVEDSVGMLELIDRWHAEHFAYLVQKMGSVQESDEATLLDNSATVWTMEQSDGAAHNTNNLPIFQVGSLGGYFKTGVAINVEDGSADLTRGNSSSQCVDGDKNIEFEELQDTGTDNAFANRPMTKYLCNLMNGVGVKGNAMGFPDPAGQLKVQNFGWSDDHEQFAGFVAGRSGEGIRDTPQGTFVDPGEFEELLA